MSEEKFRIIHVGAYWKFHVLKRCLCFWRYIGGRDYVEDCKKDIISAHIKEGKVICRFDAYGREITKSKGGQS